MVAAGAFAAFMSTSSGLLVSIAGTLSYDVWPRLHSAHAAGARARQAHFRVAAPLGIIVPIGLALAAENLDIGLLVGWAFALAASTFCPLFLLGIWWGRLTAAGAAAGILLGGSLATTAIVLDLLRVGSGSGALAALLAQPAVLTVPVAFAAMVAVSLRSPLRAEGTDRHALALHAPEELGFDVAGRARNVGAAAAAGRVSPAEPSGAWARAAPGQ
jgi:Na+(H+)/acetate symporter ActP